MKRSRRKGACYLEWLVKLVKKNGPVSLLPRLERGKAAELVIELELCKEGVQCNQVKVNDARDRMAYRLEPSLRYDSEGNLIISNIQMKYVNYTTEYYQKHGYLIHISDMLMNSPEKPDFILLVEDPIGEYKYLVLINAEMMAKIKEKGKPRSSDPGRKPRTRLYVPRKLGTGWAEHLDRFEKLKAHPMHYKLGE
jgi:hypothetical protein